MEKCYSYRDKFQGIYYPSNNSNISNTALIIVSGSDGGIKISNKLAVKFNSLNISTLAVAY